MRSITMILLLAVVVGALIAWSLAVASSRIEAAPAPAAANVCEQVAAAGNIVVYRCEPDYGLPFYLNSVGFMVLED